MGDISSSNLDSGSDRPSLARVQLLDDVQRGNELALARGADLRIYGAKADGTTDCWPALLAAAAEGHTRFALTPRPTESGTALFNTWDINALVGKTLDIDRRITLSVPDNSCVGVPASAGVRHVRDTNYWMRSLQCAYTVHADGTDVWYGSGYRRTTPRLHARDADLSQVVALAGSAFTARKIAWNSSDTWLDDTFGSSTSDAFGLASAADGALHFGMIRCKPGDEFVAQLTAGGSPLVAAVVRHTKGFAGVWSQPDYNASTANFFKKSAGLAGSNSALVFAGAGTHGSYSALGSLWTIRIDSWQSFSIMLNGYAVARYIVDGVITECGYGGYPTGSGQTMTASGLVRVRGRGYSAGEFMSAAVFGDSKSASRYDAWPAYLKDALEHAAGIRCWKVDNFAVAGQGSSEQLGVMSGVNLSAYNEVVIDIGTNPIQGQQSPGDFKTQVLAMVDMAIAAGCRVTLVVPSLWYTQGQAGARGQASTYYDRGAPYRSAIYRIAAERGAKLVDSMRSDGPVLANYVNNSLTPSMVGKGDPVVYDNIHLTTDTARRRADDIARSILGRYANKTGALYLPRHPVGVAANGWQLMASEPPKAAISAGGVVTLSGVVEVGASPVRANGTTILVLESYLWPPGTTRFGSVFAQAAGEKVDLLVTAAGEVQIRGAATSAWIDLSELSWLVEDREVI